MATIRDVAARAKVGVGTVSRVINGGRAVSDQTRRRVLDAIEELDFRPSPAARALSRRRASTIAVSAPFLTRPSVVERVRGVVEAITGSDYDLTLSTVETPEQRQRWIGDVGQRDRADGAVLISLWPTAEEEEALLQLQTPVVLVDSRSSRLPSMGIDDVEGGRIAAGHLLGLGHRRIGYVGDQVDERFRFRSSNDRLAGFRQALDQAGVPLDPGLVRLGAHDRVVASVQARELLSRPDRPTAIFASSDTQAVGVMSAARDAGLRVPGDISIIGFDDIELAEIVGLTTVRQPLADSGRLGVQRLLELLSGGDDADDGSEVLPLTIVTRRTTGPAPA